MIRIIYQIFAVAFAIFCVISVFMKMGFEVTGIFLCLNIGYTILSKLE